MKQVQHIMDKYLMTKRAIFTVFALLPMLLSGCVTQNYDNDNTPVVQNQSNRDDMAATRVSLGLGYLKMGNMPQAKQNLEKAKNFAPEMVQVYTAFAHYYETVGEDKQTVDSYEKALSIKSDDADTLNNYGVYLCRKDKIEEAEVQFLKAIAVPSYILVAKSYENLAACFLQIDNFTKAETYLNKAILHSPSSASTLLQMVQLQYAMGDYQQAKLFEQRFSKVTRRFSPQSLALSYKVHYKLGQRGVAKNYGTMLVKMYPQSWEAKQYLLNELEQIEADNLAKRYVESQQVNSLAPPKKRIVKLSPNNVKKISSEPEPAAADTQILESAPKLDTANNITKLETRVAEETLSPSSKNRVANQNTEANVERSQDIIALDTQPLANTAPSTTEKLKNSEEVIEVDQPEKNIPTDINQHKQVIVIQSDEEQSITKPTVILNAPKEQLVDSEQRIISPNKDIISEADDFEENESEEYEATPEESKNFPKFHVVSAGDTLYSISVKYNVKIHALRRWNKIAKNKNLYIKDIIFLENPKLVNQ